MSAHFILNVVPQILIIVGALFFVAGAVGLVRFPDLFSRLHALTKADNLGLGLIVAGLGWQSGSALIMLKLALIWLLVMCAGALSCHLIAQYALRSGSGGAPP